jgi:hypothetical protein
MDQSTAVGHALNLIAKPYVINDLKCDPASERKATAAVATVADNQAAIEGRAFEISATVFDTLSGLSLSAKSA